ncbi:MAG TPA: Hpt domain-containing protein [Candidatus Obscuribacterales bacterium]
MAENETKTPFNLNELIDLYGEETTFELLQMSVDEATGLLQQIHQGIDARDAKMVMAAAHQLKGLASTMTINSLAKISLELETAARQEKWENVPDAEQRLKTEFDAVAAHIATLLSGRGS